MPRYCSAPHPAPDLIERRSSQRTWFNPKAGFAAQAFLLEALQSIDRLWSAHLALSPPPFLPGDTLTHPSTAIEVNVNSSERSTDLQDSPVQYDTSYLNSLRELKFVGCIGLTALAWTLIYSGWKGYSGDSETVAVTLGMPSWIFWGITIPWCATSLATLFFALFVLREDDDDLLEQEPQMQTNSSEDAS
ncbi:hypothetical protein Poly24_18310 [Rosistilla carotiformis]|uniref:DUF997 domain-containing protein n=1 Tax=Rosistilla carotiformis TaxID=2528017 RepID=A0A518JRF4_9BACT|nr:hypothetical protein [Rosistilla carotiformis]QDV68123.1 hypothetical protein Poly24_18310 [Rosistilla carotiformis]